MASLLKSNGANDELVGKVVAYMVDLNKLSRHGIGHTYFLSIKDDESLRRLWLHKLQFVLEKAFRFDAEALKVAKDKYLALFADAASAGI